MSTFLLVLSLSAGCNTQNQPPVPTRVPITKSQLEDERNRTENLPRPDSLEQATGSLYDQAMIRYADSGFVIVTAATDSTSGGKDNWRSCAQLKPEQLGLANDTLVLFVDQNKIPCAQSPGGVVATFVVMGPRGIELSLSPHPVYWDEKMTVMIGSVSTVTIQ